MSGERDEREQEDGPAEDDRPDRGDGGEPGEAGEAGEAEGGQVLPAKAAIQVRLVVEAFRETGIDIGVATTAAGHIDYVYERGVLLVRDGYIDQVRNVVGGGETVDGLIDGVTVYSLQGAEITQATGALEAIDAQLGASVATPNQVLSVSPVALCPATEPEEPPAPAAPDPGPCEGNRGDGVFVYIADTGLLAGATTHPWLTGVTGELDPLPPPGPGGVVVIPPYTGHGTFIAGVARCMAPQAQVRVDNVFSEAGAALETKIVKALDKALGLVPDVISLSAGGTSRHDHPLLAFEAFWERYRHYKGLLLVAAAGNNSDRRPFWPAAFPQVVSVGALSANWRSRASFSDFGRWVDVYAPGEGLVNAYASGTYVCREPPHTGEIRAFHGMARWSGTSFSTPLVAGLITARMYRTGENGQQAADALLAVARAQAIPGLGPVLFPCETDSKRGHPDCCDHRHPCGHC